MAREVSYYSYVFIKDSMLSVLGIAILAMVAWSVIVRDGDYPQRRPLWFTAETLVIGFIGALPMLFLGYTRKATTFETIAEFAILVIKFGLFHVLLQYSGFYTHLFPDSLE